MAEPSSAPRKTQLPKTILVSRILSLIAFGTSIIPYVWCIGIIALAERARQYLGYWPRPSHPDPKHLPFELHHTLLWNMFECLKWSLITMPLCYISSRFLIKAQLTRKPLRIYLIGWTIIIAMIVIPKIDLVMWFMD